MRIVRFRKAAIALAIWITLTLLALLPDGSHAESDYANDCSALVPLPPPSASTSPSALLSQLPLSKGRFLVASRKLIDPQFSEAVVLLIDYDSQGAMGLTINRPSEVQLSSILPDLKGLEHRQDTIFIGGPIAREQVFLLVRSASQLERARRVFADIHVSSSRSLLERMLDSPTPGEEFRVYAGYAGWGPGQLDQEVARGSWHIVQADSEMVFDKAPSEVWPELIRRSSAQWVMVQAPGGIRASPRKDPVRPEALFDESSHGARMPLPAS